MLTCYRKNIALVPVLFMLIAATACRKNDNAAPTQTNVNTDMPLAQPLNDFNTGGVYKGVLTGMHSGNFILLLENGNKLNAAVITYNNILDTLYTQDLLGWQPGSPVYASFSSAHAKGSFVLNVVIDKDGMGDIAITAKAMNTNEEADSAIAVAGLKELSSLKVHTYEGTYTMAGQQAPAGKWNFVLRGQVLNGLIRDNTSRHLGTLSGNAAAAVCKLDNLEGSFSIGSQASFINGSWPGGKYQTQQTN